MRTDRRSSGLSTPAGKKTACRYLRVEPLERRAMLSVFAGPVMPPVSRATLTEPSARAVVADSPKAPSELIHMTTQTTATSPEGFLMISVAAEPAPTKAVVIAQPVTKVADAIFTQSQEHSDGVRAASHVTAALQAAADSQTDGVATTDGLAGVYRPGGANSIAEGWTDARIATLMGQLPSDGLGLAPVGTWTTSPSPLPDDGTQVFTKTDGSDPGGFIDLGAGAGRRLALSFRIPPASLPASPPADTLDTASDGLRLVGAFVATEHAQPGLAAGTETLKNPEGPSLGVAERSGSMIAFEPSGPAVSPAGDANVAMNWGGSVAASEPVNSAAEGGLAEIDVGPGTSRPFGQTEGAPNMATSKAADPDAAKSVETAPDNSAAIADNGAPQAGSVAAKEDAVEGRQGALDAEEGGGIALAAATPSPRQGYDVSVAASGPRGPSSSKGLTEIRMESAVGLFEAFELATGDGQDRGVPSPPANDTAADGAAAASAPQLASDSPVGQEAASPHREQDQASVQHASTAPLLAAALLIAASNGLGVYSLSRKRDDPRQHPRRLG
jgi:hypothetical protein